MADRSFQSDTTFYKYTGKERDVTTGFDYFGARYYESRIGRWGQVDPLLEKYPSWNPYNYSLANSLNIFDPDGKDAIYILFSKYRIQTGGKNIPGIGHAGVLLVDNKTGKSVYYDYGRFGTQGKGIVRRLETGNIEFNKDGSINESSLTSVLKEISSSYGKESEIEGAYVKSDKFEEMYNYAEDKFKQSTDPSSKDEYNLVTCNCATFASDVIEQDKSVTTPGIPFITLPKEYLWWYRVWYNNVDYNKQSEKYKISE